MFSKKYSLGPTIGKGQFGNVKIAFRRNDPFHRKFAVKIIKDSKCNDHVNREITILSTCVHPHVISCIEHFSESNKHYIVMDYVNGGDLFDIVKYGPIKEKLAKRLFAQIVSAVEYFHGNLIAHRDLKPENILVDKDNNIKITDFGFANYINVDTLHKTFCGSPHYTAPEVVLNKKYNPMKSDIWSLGVILYVMTTGCFPWRTNNIKEVLKCIVNCEYTIPEKLSSRLKDLLINILVFEPKKRSSISDIKQHPWLVNHALQSYLPHRTPIRNIDLILVEKIVSLGFKMDSLLLDLANGCNTQATSMYHLLVEKYQPKRFGTTGKSNTNPELIKRKHKEDMTKSLSPTFLRKDSRMRNIL